jgi:fructokinase
MGPRIYCIGEIVLDIVFKNDLPVKATPGGSMLNSAVSLGRTGCRVSFIGECGKDHAGDLIAGFLDKNSVDTSYLVQPGKSQSTIALAFLNERNDAEFSFYKSPAGYLKRPEPPILERDFLLFGSFYAISPATAHVVYDLAEKASENGSILFYDPNFRRPHLSQLPKLRKRIENSIRLADIVRGSQEDFQLIFGTDTAEKTRNLDVFGPDKILIYTMGEKEVHLFAGEQHHIYTVPSLEPISTIGAGDSFNAGVLKFLSESSFRKHQSINWDKAISEGIKFAQAVCMSYENYVPENFG